MTKVINSPCAASRARVDCLPYSSQSGFINKPSSSQTTHARARTREAHAAIRNPEAYFRAWRMAKFGGDFDPIRVAVEEAVAAFSSGKGEKGKTSDRGMWLKIANRVGLSAFLDAFEQKSSEIRVSAFLDAFEQKSSEIRDLENRGRRLLNPAASFQKLLNKRFPKNPPSPKATEDKGGGAV